MGERGSIGKIVPTPKVFSPCWTRTIAKLRSHLALFVPRTQPQLEGYYGY